MGLLRSRGAESSQSRSRDREFAVERTGRHHQTEHLLMEDEAHLCWWVQPVQDIRSIVQPLVSGPPPTRLQHALYL